MFRQTLARELRAFRRAFTFPVSPSVVANRIAGAAPIWLDARPMSPSFHLPLLSGLMRRRRHARHVVAPPADLAADAAFMAAWERCRPFTMTSIERMHSLWVAARHVALARLDGDFVECGVWKGGSSMLAALALQSAGDTTRPLWLYDTFSGMTEPTGRDVDLAGRAARDEWSAKQAKSAKGDGWCASPLDEVKAALAATGVAPGRLHFVVGKVEETIPQQAPAKIALLRLDTDWYESTRHELLHLWPRLVSGGLLIIDDYGHWAGARAAVDEFLAAQKTPLLLHRIDYTGRIAQKP
jgi:O-methyltransferase